MALIDLFNSGEEDLFSKIVKNSKKIISKLPKKQVNNKDDSLDTVTSYLSLNSNKPDSKDTTESNNTEIAEIFKNISVPKKRIEKYKIYDELFDSLQIIKNVIEVYRDSIAPTDNINNDSLFVKVTSQGNDDSKNSAYHKDSCEDMLEFYNFDNLHKNIIIPNTLKYGDMFIEIIDLEEKHIEYNKILSNKSTDKKVNSVVMENRVDDLFLENLNTRINYQKQSTIITEEDYKKLTDIFIEYGDTQEIYNDIILEKKVRVKSTKVYNIFDRIILKPHLPHNIIPIITSYNTVLGYVYIIPNETENKDNVRNPFNTMLNIVNKIGSGDLTNQNRTEKYDDIIKKFSTHLTKKILKDLKVVNNDTDFESKTNQEYDDALKQTLEPNIYLSLKNLIYSANSKEIDFNKLKVRYIDASKMCHYSINNSFSYPYGTSILDQLVFPGKMYLLTLMTNMITKVSRASLVRNWKIEAGSRLDHRKQVETLKRQLRNSRLSASDLVSTKNLSQIMTDFRDVFTILQNGKEKIAVELMQQGNPDVKIQDLEDLRRELVALTGIPASMLGLQDQGGNDTREYLINTNVAFATKVSSKQQMFNKVNTELFDKVFKTLNPDSDKGKPSEYIKISLLPPTTLMMQLTASSMQSTSDIVRTISDMKQYNINYNYFLSKYCPWIDWKEFEQQQLDFELKSAAKKASAATDQLGSGGGY